MGPLDQAPTKSLPPAGECRGSSRPADGSLQRQPRGAGRYQSQAGREHTHIQHPCRYRPGLASEDYATIRCGGARPCAGGWVITRRPGACDSEPGAWDFSHLAVTAHPATRALHPLTSSATLVRQ